MARKKKGKNPQVEDYRHEDAKRKNIARENGLQLIE